MFALKMMNLCNKFKALGEGSVHLKNETGVSFGILSQGRSSTKIVGGGGGGGRFEKMSTTMVGRRRKV